MCVLGHGGGSVLLVHFLALLASNGGGGRVDRLFLHAVTTHCAPGMPDVIAESKLKKWPGR